MDVKKVIDWLSLKQIKGQAVCRENLTTILSDVELMPCIDCLGEPDLLGMLSEKDYEKNNAAPCFPDGNKRTYFYMVCLDCVKDLSKKNIYEKIQTLSFRMSN